MHQLLLAVVRLPEVRDGDPERCSRLLADLLAEFPFYTNLGVVGTDGDLGAAAPLPAAPSTMPTAPGSKKSSAHAIMPSADMWKDMWRASRWRDMPILSSTRTARSRRPSLPRRPGLAQRLRGAGAVALRRSFDCSGC